MSSNRPKPLNLKSVEADDASIPVVPVAATPTTSTPVTPAPVAKAAAAAAPSPRISIFADMSTKWMTQAIEHQMDMLVKKHPRAKTFELTGSVVRGENPVFKLQSSESPNAHALFSVDLRGMAMIKALLEPNPPKQPALAAKK